MWVEGTVGGGVIGTVVTDRVPGAIVNGEMILGICSLVMSIANTEKAFLSSIFLHFY